MAVPEEQLQGDPEERLYASAPIDTDDGPVVVIHEQDAAGRGRAGAGLVVAASLRVVSRTRADARRRAASLRRWAS